MPTVLYAEDEMFLGKIVKESLESRGFTVIMESDGEKVFPLYQQTNPDICVLDIMMPNKDGFAVAGEIRSVNREIPILFLTAKVQTEDVLKGFNTGGNDYIRKPFSMEELIVRINNLLQLSGSAVNAPSDNSNLRIGKLTFNLPRQVLSGGSEDRKLSFRETELLRYLFEHRNTIIDRRDLLKQLWGNDNFFNSRNLDVYVTRLRSFLKDDPSLEILTIKGIGYRFVIS
jgi:DNA-binding response OmpR family regulator